MKAIIRSDYGTAGVLQLADVEQPAPSGRQLLVKIRAAALNPLDWHVMRGTPYLMRIGLGLARPWSVRLGADFAGVVEAVGRRVVRFQPGDEVFGIARGAFAEYVTVSETAGVARKPAVITFEEAAAVPVAGVTALQALRDKGRLRPGQDVLINGASGGVGTFAVQIAKSLGAQVAGVCSTRNVEMVRSLGAGRVFDYTREDFARSGCQYDVLLDNVGNRSLSDCRRVLKPRGTYVGNGGGGPDDNQWGFAMIAGMMRSLVVSWFGSRKLRGILANVNQNDLTALGELIVTGQITPVIGRRFGLSEVPDAIRYLESARARGKVIITL